MCIVSLCRTAGILSCLDGYMNAALENCVEVVNGKELRNYGDTFLRGNNSAWSCLNGARESLVRTRRRPAKVLHTSSLFMR